jgi:hypothetical protein
VNGSQAFLQSFPEVVIVKLVIAKSSKWRGGNVRALARLAHGVTPSAQCFEQVFSSLLLAIEGKAGVTPGAYHQEHGANVLHGILYLQAELPRRK